jgi:hypothetical protein
MISLTFARVIQFAKRVGDFATLFQVFADQRRRTAEQYETTYFDGDVLLVGESETNDGVDIPTSSWKEPKGIAGAVLLVTLTLNNRR